MVSVDGWEVGFWIYLKVKQILTDGLAVKCYCIKNEEISKVWLGIFEMSVEHQVEYQEAIRCINEFKGSVWVEDGKCT